MIDQAQIGFLGLGKMGGLMARHLLTADTRLHVFDPNPAAMAPFVEAGAVACTSPKDVADKATVILASLPTPAVSEAAAFGAEGVIHGSAVRTYVELSTIGRPTVESIAGKLAEAGIDMLDAPISGGSNGARNGTVAVMAAGSATSIVAARPYLERIGSRVFVIGERPGLGQMMKLVNNMISATIMASTYETLVLGTKAGLDPEMMVSVINASTGRNSATLEKVPQAILPGTFDFGSATRIIFKDVELGLEEAHQLGVPMWVTETVGQVWRFAMSQGAAEDDYTTLIRFMEGWAGVEVRSHGNGPAVD